jgi:hypothetical protein
MSIDEGWGYGSEDDEEGGAGAFGDLNPNEQESPWGAGEAPPTFRPITTSSRITEAAYSPRSRRLYVRFVKPEPGGTPWTYYDVPPNVWRNFLRARSKGKFVNRLLNNYNYGPGWGPER